MTDDILLIIKREASDALSRLDEYNEHARIRNDLAKKEDYKRRLGLPYTPGLEIPEMSEDDVIMQAYEKHIQDIKSQEETNNIYVYIGTFKYTRPSYGEIKIGAPLVEECDKNDIDADYRCYANMEGRFSLRITMDKVEEFESNHTVLFSRSAYEIERDFVTTAVKENQDKALNLVLYKYQK